MNPAAPPIFLFTGPTAYYLAPERLLSLPLTRMQPAESGAFDALVNQTEGPGEIILVDSIQTQGKLLAPEEINRALARGWQFWGIASTGAMMAARMKVPGLRGFGVVFRQYLIEQSLTENEIILLHSLTPPYTPLSEPLFHLRLLIQQLAARGLFSRSKASVILTQLEEMPLEDRTLSTLSTLLIKKGGMTPEECRKAIEEIPRFRAKNNDFDRFLRYRFPPVNAQSEFRQELQGPCTTLTA